MSEAKTSTVRVPFCVDQWVEIGPPSGDKVLGVIESIKIKRTGFEIECQWFVGDDVVTRIVQRDYIHPVDPERTDIGFHAGQLPEGESSE